MLRALASQGRRAAMQAAQRTVAHDEAIRRLRAARAPGRQAPRPLADAGRRRSPQVAHRLRRPPHDAPAGHGRADRGRRGDGRRRRRRGLRRDRRHVRPLLGRVPARLHRRRRAAAAEHGALRRRVRQRVLGRVADDLRGRRRHGLQPLHDRRRRRRPRADARRHRQPRRAAVPGPVRRAERVDVRRVRVAGQAVRQRADGRGGRLADRRGPLHLPGQTASPCAR